MKSTVIFSCLIKIVLGQENDFIFKDIDQSEADNPLAIENTEATGTEEVLSSELEKGSVEICSDTLMVDDSLEDYSKTLGQCCSMNLQCQSACCEGSRCVFTILPCVDDGSIPSSASESVDLGAAGLSGDEIEGDLSLQDELIEELHEREGDPKYEDMFSALVYDHDGFYSDLDRESPYKSHKNGNLAS